MKLNSLGRRKSYWIVPRYEAYLRNQDRETEAEHAKEIISRPERDRSVGWSASSAGTCLRAQLYKARGAKQASPTDKAMNIFQNGHYVHLRHQTAGLTAGYLVAAEVPVRIDSLNVLGTMDGDTVEDSVAEYKSINTYGFSSVSRFGPKEEHLRQVTAYMWASGRDKARVVYEDKNTNEMQEFLVPFDKELHAANIADWKELNDRMEDGSMPEMLPECRVQEGRFKWCPFAETCQRDAAGSRLRIRRTSSSDDA